MRSAVHTADVTVREGRATDGPRVLAAFNAAFAAVDPSFRARALAAWTWRFERNPAGSRMMLAVDGEGRVLAQYAALGLRVAVDGELLPASHAVDSFCDPRVRGGLAREGLFVRTGYAFAERFGGPGADRFMFGLPVRTALRVGRAHLGYRMLDPLLLLERTGSAGRCGAQQPAVEVREAPRFPSELDGFFARVAAERDAIAVRDRAQLTWRYAEHPEHTYRLGLARRDGELAGYAVLRLGAFDGREGMVICDWLVAREGAAETHAALLAWAARSASGAGAARLIAAFSPHAPEFLALQERGFLVRATSYPVVGRSYERRRDVGWWARRFDYGLGDTDLV